MIAFYRPGWSYRAEQAVRMLPRAHYFQVTIYRIRPGDEADGRCGGLASLLCRKRDQCARQGGAEDQRRLELNREHLLLRVEPRLSHVSDDFAEADPEFWRGKPGGSR